MAYIQAPFHVLRTNPEEIWAAFGRTKAVPEPYSR
jgi:hypothetical protein